MSLCLSIISSKKQALSNSLQLFLQAAVIWLIQECGSNQQPTLRQPAQSSRDAGRRVMLAGSELAVRGAGATHRGQSEVSIYITESEINNM